MKTGHVLLFGIWWVAAAVLFEPASGQNASNPFPLVTVPDTPANISSTARKTFTTTLRLIPRLSSSRFSENTFVTSLQEYYSDEIGIEGFISLSNVESTTTGQYTEVTFDVTYSFNTMVGGGATDELISNTIGNVAAIATFLRNRQGVDIYTFFTLNEDPSTFSYSGSSMCDVAFPCERFSVCTETLDGVTAECVSQCKREFCMNGGTCMQMSADLPPSCTCPSVRDLWLVGDRCEVMIALWMVIIIAIGAFIVIIIAIVIACCCYGSARRRKEKEALGGDMNGVSNGAFIHNEEKIVPVVTEPVAAAKANSYDNVPEETERRRNRRQYSSRRRGRRYSPSPSLTTSEDNYRSRREAERNERNSRRRRSPSRSPPPSSEEDSFDDDEESTDEAASVAINTDTLPYANSGLTVKPLSTEVSAAESDATSEESSDGVSVTNGVELKEQGTSPIRWKKPVKPTGIDIATRRGWTPSLGPQMFNLERSTDRLNSLSDHNESDTQYSVGTTDI